MRRESYSKPPGDQFQTSTFRTEKSVSGLPTGSDREREQALPAGAATPNSVSRDGGPADKGQGVGGRSLPYGTYNGPASGSGTPEKARTKGVPGDQYGTPSKDDYGYLTRRTMTGAESDVVAYEPRKRGPSSYAPHPLGWRRHRQKPTVRNKRRKNYRRRRSQELMQARRRYRTRYRNNPRFKRRRDWCRKNPNRCKMRTTPRRRVAADPAIPFLYGCDLEQGYVVGVSANGSLILERADGLETLVSVTAFVRTAVFLDDSDIDAVDRLVDSSEAEDPYGDPTPGDVAAAAALHRVAVPPEGTPEAQLDAIFEAIMDGCGDNMRTAFDTILYDQAPASERPSTWMDRDEPTREVADTHPYSENAPGQWTHTRKEQTHVPSDGADTSPNPTYYQGGSGKVIPDDMRLAAAWGPTMHRTASNLSDFGFDEFDDVEPGATTPAYQAELDFERQVGHPSQQMMLNEMLVRDPEVVRVADHRFRYVAPHRAWFIHTGMDDAAARRFGARAFRGLVGRRNVPAHLPALHQVPLWVGTADGRALRVDPPRGKSGNVTSDNMRLARFDLAPMSPLDGVFVDFGSTRFDDPIETDEQGGFRVRVSRIDLDGNVVRDPGVAVFMPQGWPFTDVISASVSDVRLDDTVGMRFRDGRLIITGRATYSVQAEWGDTDERNIPVRGLMALSPAFERRLDGMQAPPPDVGTVSPAGDDSRVGVLIDLLGRVGDWGKPLVTQAIESLRAGRTLDEDTLKGLRHRLYRSNMRDEADMFRTASDRTAGVFQAPPALVAAVDAWAVSQYAGHVLAWVQSKLDGIRHDPTEDALVELARVRAEFPAAVASLRNPSDSVVISAPKVDSDGTVGVRYIGVRMVEPEVYLLDVGDKRPTFRRREVVNFPKAESNVIHDVVGAGKYSVIGQLEDRARRQAEFRKIDVPNDALLVDLLLIRNEARRYADKASDERVIRATYFPLTDAMLSGWRYADRLPPDAIERLHAEDKSRISVALNFKPRQDAAGFWNSERFIIDLYVPTYRYRGIQSLYPATVEEFKGGIAELRRVIRHEVQHAGQDILKIALGLRELGGLPPRDTRNLQYDPSGNRPGYRQQAHPERDVEFHTRLQDEIDSFVSTSHRIPIKSRARAVKLWTGLKPTTSEAPRQFFRTMMVTQPKKWARAVAEFVAGVRAAGVYIPSEGSLP